MEVLDSIYHQFFFVANSFRRQPTTFRYFQPLALLTPELAAAAIPWVLSEYDSGKKATGMYSRDEYQGRFFPSPVISCTLEATALINDKFVGHLILPLWSNFASIVALLFLSVLLSLDWLSSISFCHQFLLFQHSSAGLGTQQFPLSGLALLYFITCSIPPILRTSACDGSPSIPSSTLAECISVTWSLQQCLTGCGVRT